MQPALLTAEILCAILGVQLVAAERSHATTSLGWLAAQWSIACLGAILSVDP